MTELAILYLNIAELKISSTAIIDNPIFNIKPFEPEIYAKQIKQK